MMITARLDRFINNETVQDFRHYSTDHIRNILDRFGTPHQSLHAVHIAGTNGKGSVAHMLNGIFTEAGYTAGLYTSPHLLTVNERIIVGNSPIPDKDLSLLIDEIIGCVDSDESLNPTYFDILTACAFRYFHSRGIDIAIIETGLGGRLDSTNIVTPLCSIITDISLDHAHVLGGTLPLIAREKAGIIKPDVYVITSNLDPDIIAVLNIEARSKKAPLLRLSRDFSTTGITGTETGFRYDYAFNGRTRHDISGLEINHPMEKQVSNSSCAVTASLLLRNRFPKITDDVIRDGLQHFSAPGRFQVLCGHPLVIFDPAHNVAAMREMIGLVRVRYPRRHVLPVLTLMRDKDIGGIMDVLEEHRMRVLYFAIDDPRCYLPEPGSHPRVITRVIRADENELGRALDSEICVDSLFFFIGSFRLYGTARGYAQRHEAKCS